MTKASDALGGIGESSSHCRHSCSYAVFFHVGADIEVLTERLKVLFSGNSRAARNWRRHRRFALILCYQADRSNHPTGCRCLDGHGSYDQSATRTHRPPAPGAGSR